MPRVAWSRLDAVGIGSPLRRLADARALCTVHLVDDSTLEGVLGRVGGDFVELDEGPAAGVVVATGVIAALRAEG
ncbi:hypothetical protein [Nocardioides daphniae]|nr:hypothetical protein [Nocardioides daphniae]QCC77829.1 hypothetical protein E2C04_12735 [Nocardioides daphniae]